MTERFELTVEAKAEQLAQIGEFIADAMRAFGLDDRKSFQVQLAVDEACANVINYGYADAEAAGMIELVCCKTGEDIVVVISDAGTPFDPMSVPLPDLDATLEERTIGGLGIYFMKTLVDELTYEYRDGKNVLTMLVKGHDRTHVTVENQSRD